MAVRENKPLPTIEAQKAEFYSGFIPNFDIPGIEAQRMRFERIRLDEIITQKGKASLVGKERRLPNTKKAKLIRGRGVSALNEFEKGVLEREILQNLLYGRDATAHRAHVAREWGIRFEPHRTLP